MRKCLHLGGPPPRGGGCFLVGNSLKSPTSGKMLLGEL